MHEVSISINFYGEYQLEATKHEQVIQSSCCEREISFPPHSDQDTIYRKHKADVHLESGALNLDSMGAALYQFRPPGYDIRHQNIAFYEGGKANYNAIVQLLKEHGASSEHPDAENVFAQYDKRLGQELARKTAKRRSKFKFWDRDN